MSCYAMRVRAAIAQTVLENTRFGKPRNVVWLLEDTGVDAVSKFDYEGAVSETLEKLTSGVGVSREFDVRPGIGQMDREMAKRGISALGTLDRFVETGTQSLTNMVEGFSTAIGRTLRTERLKTNEPNGHELEESIVDGFLAAVVGAQGVWDWVTMRETLKNKIVEELLKEKKEEDFPGSVFLEEDRRMLPAFLESVRIGSENIFDALQNWYETHTLLTLAGGDQAAAATEAGASYAPSATSTGRSHQGHR